MNAFTGTYHYQGGTGRVTVEVAANPAQRAAQIRGYTLEGDRLQVTTPWAPNQSLPGAAVTRARIRFERVAR